MIFTEYIRNCLSIQELHVMHVVWTNAYLKISLMIMHYLLTLTFTALRTRSARTTWSKTIRWANMRITVIISGSAFLKNYWRLLRNTWLRVGVSCWLISIKTSQWPEKLLKEHAFSAKKRSLKPLFIAEGDIIRSVSFSSYRPSITIAYEEKKGLTSKKHRNEVFYFLCNI